jgi:hypothetical protein
VTRACGGRQVARLALDEFVGENGESDGFCCVGIDAVNRNWARLTVEEAASADGA